MSSFWETEDGEDLKDDVKAEFDIGGLEPPIPDNTTALACIEQIGWTTNFEEISGRKIAIDETDHIQLTWAILAPEELAGRKVVMNLWVSDDDPRTGGGAKAEKKRVKAKKMLLAIDANAGSKLVAKDEDPTDERLLSCLSNKPMVIKIMQMLDDDGKFITNWVRAVAPKVPVKDIPPMQVVAAPERASSRSSSRSSQSSGRGRDDDADIPF